MIEVIDDITQLPPCHHLRAIAVIDVRMLQYTGNHSRRRIAGYSILK
jgi:hypothetical protein